MILWFCFFFDCILHSQPIVRFEYHFIHLKEAPTFASGQFKFKYEQYVEMNNKENKSEKDKDWLYHNKFPEKPVSDGIINTVVWCTIFHSISHVGLLVFGLLLKLVDKQSKAYEVFLRSLKLQMNYLVNGDIVTSTSEFLKMLQKFSKPIFIVFCYFIVLF